MKFYCLAPGLRNIDLIKHIGLTPYYLASEMDYESTIVCFNNGDYTNLNNMKELNLEFLKKKYSSSILNLFVVIHYLIKNSKNIDVLNCFHLTRYSLLYFTIYKIFNRHGITHLTFDMTYETVLTLVNNDKTLLHSFKSKFVVFLFKHLIDIANIERKDSHDLLINFNDVYKEKVMYMPIFIEPNENIEVAKKNQIISVGDIGTFFKASDVVLESFANVVNTFDKNDWTLKMIGPVSEDFNDYIESFFNKNPNLKNSITFTGNISDKDELYKIYSESKIFCLPSRSESFGIVFVEALFYGDFLVTTPVGITTYLNSISNYGKFVEIDNVEDLTNTLIDVIENYDAYSRDNKINFKKLIQDEFSHEKFIKELDFRLKNLLR